MYLQTITYQLGVRLKSLMPCFHKPHLENPALLLVGIVYNRGVSSPKAASAASYRGVQTESRVGRFERLVRYQGCWFSAGEPARRGEILFWPLVRVTTEGPAQRRVNLAAVWDQGEEELWLLITNYTDAKQARQIYAMRFWIEEMFSDHKSRGFNLESTRITDHDRLERLLVAVTLTLLWIME